MSRDTERPPVGETEGRPHYSSSSDAARVDLDLLLARIHRRPDLLDRPPLDYATSAVWVHTDDGPRLCMLREAA